jgi:membrane protease YdiL (CAAX protease family)
MKTLQQIWTLPESETTPSKKAGVIMLGSTILVVFHRYVGSMEFARATFPSSAEGDAVMFMFSSLFILFGLIPGLVVTTLFRERMEDYGLQLGDWRWGGRAVFILFPPIALLMLLPAAYTEEMRAFYPFDKSALHSWSAFLRLETSRALLFYPAWEFFFRGFMLFGLRRIVGGWNAVGIQTISSCLWHIGMPTGEILAAIPGGVLFGMMALRTRSIVWPLLLHVLVGIGLDLFIVITG